MRSSLSAVRSCWVLFVLVMFACLTNRAWTQIQAGTKDGVTSAYNKSQARRTELLAGDKFKAEDKSVAEAYAQYYIYRITWTPAQQADWNFYFYKIQSDFAGSLEDIIKKKDKIHPRYIDMLGVALVDSMKAVLGNGQHATVVVNAGMMMPTMGKLRDGHVVDYLVLLVNGDQGNDVVRLYALKGLKEGMPVNLQQENDDLSDKKQARIKVEAKVVDTLRKFIEKPVNVKALKAEETAVVHYFRREAITALAAAEAPAVATYKKAGKQAARVEGPVAPTLIRVAANQVQPPPNLQERIEAAAGLCRMKHPNMPEYVPDVAVYAVGLTLADFIKEYRSDLGNIIAKKIPSYAWKYESKRFEGALSELVKNSRESSDKAARLKKLADPLLSSILRSNQIPQAQADEFEAFIGQLRPKAATVFKGFPSLDVTLK